MEENNINTESNDLKIFEPSSNPMDAYESYGYFHSSNTLFHFMKESNYLKDFLSKRVITPRYCLEDIAYLNLTINGDTFKEIQVLQKCFCDIQLHRITVKSEVLCEDSITQGKKKVMLSLLDIYGKYGIGFSKDFCVKNNFHPVHYLNEKSSYVENLTNMLGIAMKNEIEDNQISDYVINRLALAKPLHGKMKDMMLPDDSTRTKYTIYKNFHDEHEWRYIPSPQSISELNRKTNHYRIEQIFANENMWNSGRNVIQEFSSIITNEEYNSIWVNFSYSDIRYIIVPNEQERVLFIDYINEELSEKSFDCSICNVKKNRALLISKIIVLDEIGRDW